MDIDFARYDDLVHRIYDAAMEPSHWPDTMEAIAQACEASRSVMFTPMHVPNQGGFAMDFNLPATVVERWASPAGLEDPYAAASLERGLFTDGTTMTGTELVPFEALVKTPFYRHTFQPMDVGQVCSSIVFDAVDAHKIPTVLLVYRPERDPLFDRMQVEILRRLNLHVSRALGVMFHLRDSAFQVAASHTALDRLAAGVVLLDAHGRVQFCNAAAEQHLREGRAVSLKGNAGGRGQLGLVARLHHSEAQFQKAVRDAVSPLASVPDHFSNALLLPDAEGKPSCVLHVAPLGQTSALAMGVEAPRAVLFLYDLAAASRVPPGLLSELFGLTPAEARAALQMLQGGTAEDMAQRLGVTPHTFKSQLKTVYAKSGTHRQADLLKMLLALSVA